MKIIFRVDAFIKMGIGHVMRCLTLAHELKRSGSIITFVTSSDRGYIIPLIKSYGYDIETFNISRNGVTIDEATEVDYDLWNNIFWKEDAERTLQIAQKIQPDLLIVDHYGLDAKWHQILRSATKKIMVIDDLANRYLDCDLLLDQTFECTPRVYKDFTPSECNFLVGTKYALIRRDFIHLRQSAINKRKKEIEIRHILISLGGSDTKNLTYQILKILEAMEWDVYPIVDVVLTKNSQYIESIKAMANNASLNINVLINVTHMAELMLKADLAIGASGTTTWERCCLGLPSLVFGVSDNQKGILSKLDSLGAIVSLGCCTEFNGDLLSKEIVQIINNPSQYKSISKEAFTLCDGLGARWTYLAIQPIKAKDGKCVELREVTLDDSKMILKWQQMPEIRQYAKNPSIPTEEEHMRWMQEKIKENFSYFWIIMHDKEPSGILRLDNYGEKDYLISIFVTPQKFGLGIGKGAISVVQYLFEGIANLSATILPENTASLKLFESSGFIFDKEKKLFIW
jgi:UDP-2,4-diacetamido-2,4,6-trideoxy-beta-L-altropyranose hydrolase